MGSAASTAYKLGQEGAGSSSVGAGLGGVAQAAGNAAKSRMSASLGLGQAVESGRQAAFNAMVGRDAPSSAETGRDTLPVWARDMKSQASARHHGQAAMHSLQQGDRGGHGATPDLDERND
jgi:type IV secretion system protein TrbL